MVIEISERVRVYFKWKYAFLINFKFLSHTLSFSSFFKFEHFFHIENREGSIDS